MEKIIFDSQNFAGGPGGGTSSSSVTWSGATKITSAGTYSGKTYKSTTSGQNSVLVTASGKVIIKNATVKKSGGTSAGDDESFYGINSAVMCKDGGKTSIIGGTVTTSAAGANGIFSYGGNGGTNGAAGDGTTVYVSNVTIKTTDSDSDDSTGITVSGGVVIVDKTYTGKKINLSDYSSSVKKVNASKTSKGLQIVGDKYANSLVGGSGKDSLVGNAGKDTLIGGKGNDSLLGGNGNDYLSGGAGNDTFHAGADADTLLGGNGNDYLSGGYGNDSILGGSGKDTLLGGSGTDYLNGGTENDSLIGNDGKDTLLGGNGADYLSGGAENDSILGGADNDSLFGDAGNDTLNGGSGDDTLKGGNGKDIFVYEKNSGDDVITDYVAGTDKIKISSGSIDSYEISGKNIIFTIDNGTLTVKNGKGKKITVIDSSGKTTTKIYSASSSSLWFAEENNFVSSDNLSAITENNLTSTALEKIETNNFENLTTKNNFVTYSDK